MKTQTKPRIPKGFRLEDYDSDGYRKYGIFFYGGEVLFGWEKDHGIRSYEFKIALTNTGGVERLLHPEKKEFTEVVEFIFTCDLKDYIVDYETYDLDALDTMKKGDPIKMKIEKTIDLEKIILEAAPRKYKMAIQRIKRRLKGIIPDAVPFDGEHSDYFKQFEFIEFTEESAWSWAGPHRMGKKVGALAKIKEKEAPKYPVLDPRTRWGWWDLPHNLQKKLDVIAKSLDLPNGDHLIHNGRWDDKQKAKWFDERTVAERHCIASKYYKSQVSYIHELSPFSLYVCGNDDCSYTKWFSTREDAETELKRLRMMQPCDMNQDIYKQGYEFTN